ncbi:class I SAM-dependent methyltransferase [Paenibacillus antarcticus]|uniref:Methyltransferase n=1 Tax=Paenibacillus antarcticus TaxID=253703 RepID=A0A168J6N0_9BACL|nr:class I SAM-dependent methyltransferase [Paenibacillus antarcticus]OAB40222.1 methyltransferase [Paenibacillus antarcticus]
MSDLIKEQFDAVAQSYDLQRRQLIPCFDDFYSTARDWVNIDKKSPRILDIGTGTGLFAAYVQQKYPEAQLTLIDISEEMLKGARMRFGEDPNVQYISGDFATYAFDGQQYDIVISSLAIHHLAHEDKSRLFHKIYTRLTEGGIFVNADQIAGTSAYFDNLYKEQWEHTINQSGLPNEVIASAIERRKLDRNATFEDQLKWLSDAGFAEAECIYKYNEFGVFFAQK